MCGRSSWWLHDRKMFVNARAVNAILMTVLMTSDYLDDG